MNNKTTPKDFFINLGATIALYVTVGAIINLLFTLINYYRPDQLAGYFYGNSVAWPISILVVLVPLLYALEYLMIRDVRTNPEKLTIWIRRWRIYLTLFLTGAMIAGDLIALINIYLNGEISDRFVYKVLVVLIISAIIFLYYLIERIGEASSYTPKKLMIQKVTAWIGLVIVVVAIIVGFITVGSPSKQRNLRFDNQRVNDLTNIQWRILNHWQMKGTLPATLADLSDTIDSYKVPTDPKSKASYSYSIKSPMGSTGLSSAKPSFEICADFALPMEDNKGRGEFYDGNSYPTIAVSSSYGGSYLGDNNDNWKHEAGRACFTRTIDPDRYPVNVKIK